MSDQSEALAKQALEAGMTVQPLLTLPPLIEEGEFERSDLPWVHLPLEGRQGNSFNKEVGAIVKGLGLYRYKDRIVTVGTNEVSGRVEIRDMSHHRFRTWAENFMHCYKPSFTKNGALKIKQTMAVDHAQTCLASDEFSLQQPRLLKVNVVRLPIARPNGTIELLPAGYDAQSCILTVAPAWEYDEDMTVTAAKAILDDLVREFPFQDDRSRSVYFALLLSQFGYHLQTLDSRRLNFLLNANSTRSGKTLLVEIALTLAWSYASIDAMPDDPSKLRDRLDTAVREAKPFLVLDDLDVSFVRSGVLNAFMTAEWWSGRKFHSQEEFSEPKTPVVFLTGNAIETTPDIAGRTLLCELFTTEADVTSRKIERPIDAAWVRQPAVHAQLCSALWALIRNWRDGGRTHEGRVVPGFMEWSRIFGGITLAAKLGDPCETPQTDGIGNTEYQDMVALITRMARDVEGPHGEFEFHTIVGLCREENCFEYLMDGKQVKYKESGFEVVEFELSSKAKSIFGKLLGKYGGKAFVTKDGKRVIFDKRGKNRHRRYTLQVVGAGPS